MITLYAYMLVMRSGKALYGTYIEDFLHVIPNMLLTAEETLNTSDRNQKRLTIPPRAEFPCMNEN